MTIDNLIQALQAAIAPVVLISGIGLLLLTMTNRLGRSIDRVRQLCIAFKSSHRAEIKDQIKILYERCQLMRISLVLAITSVVCISIIVFALFSIYIFRISLIGLMEFLFAAGLTFLILSLLLFLQEVTLSLHSLKMEIDNTFRPPSKK